MSMVPLHHCQWIRTCIELVLTFTVCSLLYPLHFRSTHDDSKQFVQANGKSAASQVYQDARTRSDHVRMSWREMAGRSVRVCCTILVGLMSACSSASSSCTSCMQSRACNQCHVRTVP
jgi:hypothetical protein